MQKVKEVTVADVVVTEKEVSFENVETQYLPVPVIRTHFNSRFRERQYEINTMPSLTVPDDAMTIAEIVDRYNHGMQLSQKPGEFFGEESDLPNDMSNLDLAEREEILREVAKRRDDIIEDVRKRKKTAADARLKQQVDARVKKQQDEKAQYEELRKKFEEKPKEQ